MAQGSFDLAEFDVLFIWNSTCPGHLGPAVGNRIRLGLGPLTAASIPGDFRTDGSDISAPFFCAGNE
ncbi:hypothetical protein CGLO_14596 [Colletotrichum gloeosporioides Cg-14]|uniref:Uncharacterized protein n=1 Tax=Colletotrichum gloeosporioides (strain Cg-14) TaxID=1237896 RepID=T0L3X9_COLGC|nr:hypothetical protein CGLO_14596 [Colletotrichum gloeosporioides Cg-14]